MKIVFMGFQTWGTVALRSILAQEHEVELVVTHPDSGDAYESIWNESVSELALSRNIRVIACRNADDVISDVARVNPDVIVMSDWRRWVSAQVYGLARYGAINIHDALLPRYGGFAPINWAIANGETETGVTVHFVSDELDLGDIILQERIPISPSATATEIFHNVISVIPKLTVAALRLLESGTAPRIAQNRSLATFYHRRSEQDGLINWQRGVADIYNLVRAQSDPYPNAYTFYNKRKLRIKRASIGNPKYRGTPGRVCCRSGDAVVIVCGDQGACLGGSLRVEIVQEDGAEAISAARYFPASAGYLG